MPLLIPASVLMLSATGVPASPGTVTQRSQEGDVEWRLSHADSAQDARRLNIMADAACAEAHGSGQGHCFPRGRDWETLAGVAISDWASPPVQVQELTLGVQAVFVADDDGSRRTPITPAQVQQWVGRANEIFERSRIRLEFDPDPASGHWSELNSTLMNTLTGEGNPDWSAQYPLSQSIADEHPDRMTVFFRWGLDPVFPTGAGFSWTSIDFVAMPAFDHTGVCGVQNIGLFAHEVGHYLGLFHTFWWLSDTIEQAELTFISEGRNPNTFDGDPYDASLPDPFVWSGPVQCDVASIELDGVEFVLPRTNPMSYYHPTQEFELAQTSTMRQVLALRTGQDLRTLVGGTNARLIEGEDINRVVNGGAAWKQDMDGFFHGRWSDGDHVLWIDADPGEMFFSGVSVPRGGPHRVYASFTAAPDFAIVRHAINGQEGDEIDLYARHVVPTGPVYLGDFDLDQGLNDFIVEIVGTNPRAVTPPRYGYGLDYLILQPLCVADLAADGTLNLDDLDAFVAAFLGGDLLADLDANGVLNLDDLDAFVTSFLAGCP